MTGAWELRNKPHRHYRLNGSWSIKGVGRIASVTQVLNGANGGLTSWAASQAVTACVDTAETWFGAGPAMAESVLSFRELTALSAAWPDAVRDRAAERGTAAHEYFAARLRDSQKPAQNAADYGLRAAVEHFIRLEHPQPAHDNNGCRVERAVGDTSRAVAGTYDAACHIGGALHRLDVKTSSTVRPEHFAQLAAYERCGVACGEPQSNFLSVVHLRATGDYRLYSMAVNSAEHLLALDMFDACLIVYRASSRLTKLTKDITHGTDS